MDISRREFLGYGAAAGAMSVGAPLPLRAFPTRSWIVSPEQGQCSLPESAPGYRAALPAERGASSREGPCSLLVIPALLSFDRRLVVWIESSLQRGATVIVESGAAFAGRSSFQNHRRALRDGLQLDVHTPVELWAQHARPGRIPYIDYTWPHHAKLRDFSRVVPLADQPGDVIGWADDLPVALKRRIGTGTLIYLGSPLGPALWARDAEAKRWLLALLA
jgi:hypothetical protein